MPSITLVLYGQLMASASQSYDVDIIMLILQMGWSPEVRILAWGHSASTPRAGTRTQGYLTLFRAAYFHFLTLPQWAVTKKIRL